MFFKAHCNAYKFSGSITHKKSVILLYRHPHLLLKCVSDKSLQDRVPPMLKMGQHACSGPRMPISTFFTGPLPTNFAKLRWVVASSTEWEGCADRAGCAH